MTIVNILAFFNVVASSQISPHVSTFAGAFPFSGRKDIYKSDIFKILCIRDVSSGQLIGKKGEMIP